VLLAFAVARLFPNVKSNSLEPGWVPTKMGGAGAPDDIDNAQRTQVWLATGRRAGCNGFREIFLSPKASRSGSCYDGYRTASFIARLVSQGFRHGSDRAVTG
jgi:hypothetical protein